MSRFAKFIRSVLGKLFRRPLIDMDTDLAPEAEVSPHYRTIMTLNDQLKTYGD